MLIDVISKRDNSIRKSTDYATGTLYDSQVGMWVRGEKEKIITTGALCNAITGIAAMKNRFKSTLGLGWLFRSLALYPKSEAIILDTENLGTRDEQRTLRLMGEDYDPTLLDRIRFMDTEESSVAYFYDIVLQLIEERSTHRDDYLVESPFVDSRTGKRQLCWIPLYLMVDSVTYMRVDEAMKLMRDGKLKEGSVNRVFMVAGQRKGLLLEELNYYASQYGIVIIGTSHIGSNNMMDGGGMPGQAPSKEFVHSKPGEKTKGSSNAFERLSCPMLNVTGVNRSMNSTKTEVRYGLTGFKEPLEDQNEVDIRVIRGKTNIAGITVPYIVSQASGLLRDATNYHFLKDRQKKYGMTGNDITQRMDLLPEVAITRNTVRGQALSSYEFRRALEITAQLAYVQSYWNLTQVPFDMFLTPKAIYEAFNQSTTTSIKDLLNTRGYWTYEDPNNREYMSVFDIVRIAHSLKSNHTALSPKK